MKNTKAIALFSVVLVLAESIFPVTSAYAAKESVKAIAMNTETQTGTKGYWSDKNAPEFYGTTKIVLKKGMEFSLEDTKYRIFAKDFEDFDLTPKINAAHNVNTDKAGEYEITYSVIDSHGNTTTLTVPVTVTEEEGINPRIERTMYSLPSVDNIHAMQIYRGNNHDRQMLGIFVKAEGTVRIRKVSGASNLTYTMLNNDSQKETSKTITNEWQDITFGYDYTPFIKTLYKQESPVKVEIEWEEEQQKVSTLNYFHDGDDEEEFFSTWENDTDAYAVIEGEAVTILVPYDDRKKLVRYYQKSHPSLDAVLDYWKKTTDAYDDMLGLQYAPEDANDQNVKTRYFVKANKHGAGAAYYAGDHVGINNASVASFFEVNWGGLHEFAHGYQGSLGKGDLNIGEVSNNIFGHYVQMNKDIYKYNDDWLGKLPAIEEKYNASHKEGKTFLDLEVSGKLYFIINLLDSFEGADTYKEIARIYRKNIIANNEMSSQDAWALGIFETYGVNITNYLESWGIKISEELKTKFKKSNAKNAFALKDILKDDAMTAQVQERLGLNAKYQLVTNEQLAGLGMKGSVNVTLNIDDMSAIEGKYVDLLEGNNKVARAKVKKGTATFTDIPVGTYTLQGPELVGDYLQASSGLLVHPDSTSKAVISYTKLDTQFANDVMIQFQGYYYKDAAQVTLSKDEAGMKLNFRYRGTTLFNGGLPADYEYAKIQVLDTAGEEVYLKKVGGAREMFSTVVLTTEELEVKEGYQIVLKYHNAKDKLRFIGSLNGDEREAYQIANNEEASYIITKDGIKKASFSENEFYVERKERAAAYLEKAIGSMSEEELYDRSLYQKKKAEIVHIYQTLNAEDKEAYKEAVLKMVKGHAPTISVLKNDLEFKINDKVDPYALIAASDVEDGILSADQIKIETDLDLTKAGSYTVTYLATDTDGNVTKASVKVTVVSNSVFVPIENEKPVQTAAPVATKKPTQTTAPVATKKPVQTQTPIKLDKASASIYAKTTLALKVKGLPSNKKAVWKSSDKKIATVDSNGKVKAVKAGNVTITATADGKSAVCKLTVKKAETRLNATTAILTTSKNKTKTLIATVNGKKAAGKEVKWKSGNSKIVTVSSTGKLTAKKTGIATITATGKNGVKATCKVIVNPSLTLKKSSASIKKNKTVKIQATAKPGNAAISYSSANKSIATVSKTGVVTGKKKGTTTITVSSNGIKKKFKVTVK